MKSKATAKDSGSVEDMIVGGEGLEIFLLLSTPSPLGDLYSEHYIWLSWRVVCKARGGGGGGASERKWSFVPGFLPALLLAQPGL